MDKKRLAAMLAATAAPGFATLAKGQLQEPRAAATLPPPVPTAPTLRGEDEIASRQRLNREQAEFAARQLAENDAAKAAHDRAVAAREAAMAAQAAEQQRLMREHEQAMAQWRADQEACAAGNARRCGPQS